MRVSAVHGSSSCPQEQSSGAGSRTPSCRCPCVYRVASVAVKSKSKSSTGASFVDPVSFVFTGTAAVHVHRVVRAFCGVRGCRAVGACAYSTITRACVFTPSRSLLYFVFESIIVMVIGIVIVPRRFVAMKVAQGMCHSSIALLLSVIVA